MNVASIAKDPDERRELGRLFQNLIWAGINQKGAVEEWWATCEQQHRNEFDEDADDDRLQPVNLPFSQPRADMLQSQIATIITKQFPYMLAETQLDDEAETALEKSVHSFWKSARFEHVVRLAARIAVDTNRVWIKQSWQLDQNRAYGGVIFDVIHPKHCVIYPCTVEGITNARIVGNRFYRRRREIEQMQQQGLYLPGEITTAGDSPEEYDTDGEIANTGASPSSFGPDPMDYRVELWDCLVRYGKKKDTTGKDGQDVYEPEKWYRVVLAFKQGLILSCEEYPYTRPWYFDFRLITDNDDAYWPGVSVMRNLSALQDTVNQSMTGFYNGSMMGAYPPIFGQDMMEKDTTYDWGEVIPTDMPANSLWSPSVSFKGDGLLRILEICDETGDKTARISANTQGALQSRDTTATENSIIASGVAVGLEEYLNEFGEGLVDMAVFTSELLFTHWAEWQGFWAQALKVMAPDIYKAPTLWEVNGSTPGNTPGAKLAALEKLVGLVQVFGPATGVDPYEFFSYALNLCNLQGSNNIQSKKEVMQANAQAQQLAQQQPQPPGAGPNSGPVPSPGMAPPPGFPPGAGANGPPPVGANGPQLQPNPNGPIPGPSGTH